MAMTDNQCMNISNPDPYYSLQTNPGSEYYKPYSVLTIRNSDMLLEML
jgi:hypothetical protein